MLALALCLAGCAAQPNVQFAQDLIDNHDCLPEKVLTGRLTNDLTLESDEEGLRRLIWPGSYSLRWSALAGHFDVLDGTGAVVATTGRRYRVGGSEFVAAGNAFWVCGGLTPLEP